MKAGLQRGLRCLAAIAIAAAGLLSAGLSFLDATVWEEVFFHSRFEWKIRLIALICVADVIVSTTAAVKILQRSQSLAEAEAPPAIIKGSADTSAPDRI
jgi:hypothetical protein